MFEVGDIVYDTDIERYLEIISVSDNRHKSGEYPILCSNNSSYTSSGQYLKYGKKNLIKVENVILKRAYKSRRYI